METNTSRGKSFKPDFKGITFPKTQIEDAADGARVITLPWGDIESMAKAVMTCLRACRLNGQRCTGLLHYGNVYKAVVNPEYNPKALKKAPCQKNTKTK